MSKSIPTVIVIILVILAGVYFFRVKGISSSDLYRFQSDCAEKATSFAKQKSDEELRLWSLLQNKFNTKKVSCFGEFSFRNNAGGVTKTIYDLTLNKEIVFVPSLEPGQLNVANPQAVIDFHNEYLTKYMNAMEEIFDNN
jgi:hypothetical protein